MTKGLPPISNLPNLSAQDRAAVLDYLFEPCIPLHSLSLELLRAKSFADYDDLVSSVGVQLSDLAGSTSTSDTQWLHDILAAHPRLGEKKVDSAQSSAEQAHLKETEDNEDTSLPDLNTLYEEKFPGLRYVVFVNGRSRDTIKQDMKLRIQRGDYGLERADAIKAMCEIAADRARKSKND